MEAKLCQYQIKVRFILFLTIYKSVCSHLVHVDKIMFEDEAFCKLCYFNNAVAQILWHLEPIRINQHNSLAGQCKPTSYCTLMLYAAHTAVVQTWNV